MKTEETEDSVFWFVLFFAPLVAFGFWLFGKSVKVGVYLYNFFSWDVKLGKRE